ncbi:unnamed protein product [Paramecium sonneborni]|uniref:Uncharacterized protein n=1 Tax=Paramecium sonneborni TaxID=65129 RepID=A0A8S1MU76_9CILI|nr:unnamed protein product [Paramecium sonneborni]
MSKKQKYTQKQTKKILAQDINESDQSHFFSLLGDDYENNDNIKVAQKILGDYKTLLQYSANKFWATISYNLNLQNSLDLFLRYAPRKYFLKETLHFTGYYGVLLKEIFKCVFAIYLRLIDLQNEDEILYEQIGVHDLVYQKWIFDVMKLTDICTIYAHQNENAVKKICQFVFNYQAYQDDYKSTIDSFMKNVLQKIYEEIFQINNKSANESEIIISDVEQKMELLTLMLDSIETAIVWAKYFPQKQHLFKPEIMQCFEQIFYELILAKGYSRGSTQLAGIWKSQYLQNLNYFLKQAVQRLIEFFVLYMRYVEDLIMTKQIKQCQEHMVYLIQNFGTMKRKFKSKKGNQSQNKEWTLFEALYENNFNMIELLMNTPWNQINLPKDDIEEVTLLMTTVIDERERLKDRMNNNEIENFDVFENFDPSQSTLPKEILEIDEKQEIEDQEEDVKEKEGNVEVKQEEKLVEIISKKKQKLTFDQPLKDRIEMAEITAKLYNDEPDDTYDYQEALQRPEKEYTSSDEDEFDDYVPNDHFVRYAQPPSKKQFNSQVNSGHSLSYQNLDSNNDKQKKIFQNPNKQPQQQYQQKDQKSYEKGFSDEEDDQGGKNKNNKNNKNSYNDNRGFQEKSQKVYVRENQYYNNNNEYQRKQQNNNNQKQEDRNKNRNQEQQRNDDSYKRDDYDREERVQGNNNDQKKVLQKERNRDGGYVGSNKTKTQQEYEQKQESNYEQQQKQNNNNKNRQQQQTRKNLNLKAPSYELFVPKEEYEQKEQQVQEQRQDKKHQRGQK